MSKKGVVDIDLEEILLREVAGCRGAQEFVPQNPSVSAASDPAEVEFVQERQSHPGYEKLFLKTCSVQERSAIYISAATKRKLIAVVRRLGGNRLSLTTFVENILSHHLELFRDEINRLHKKSNNII